MERDSSQDRPPNAVTDAAMRKMRGWFASGVTVVTTALDGRLHGLTVSAFTAASLDPPLVLVSLADETTSCDMIAASGLFAVNILSEEQEFLSERFAARAPLVNDDFEGVPYHVEATGAPILQGSLAWYDCRVVATYDGGDHTLFLGQVASIGWDESRKPLLYFVNRYARLGP